MTGRKILIISPTPTHPQTAGNRTRVDALLTSLRQLGHDVYFCHIRDEPGDEGTMRRIWGDRFLSIPYRKPRSPGLRWKRKIKSLFNREARYLYTIDEWYDPAVDRYISKFYSEHHFDTVIVEYIFFSRALRLFGENVLKIIDTHDVFSNRHRRYLERGNEPRWYSTTPAEEARGLSRADVVLAIQDKEREYLAGLTPRKVITVGHVVALHEPAQDRLTAKRIAFVASENPINSDGIKYFITEVYPLIKDELPGVELVVAGSVCNVVPDQPGVVKLGRVEDLLGVYASSSLVINPVLISTGLSIKNLEALGYSKPLVTTTAGAGGLRDGMETVFRVADSPADFAQAVVELLSDAAYAGELARRAYQYAARRNSDVMMQLQKILS